MCGRIHASGGTPGPLVNYDTDNTTLQRFQIKGDLQLQQEVGGLSGGYAYEKYDYSDGQMAGYSSFYPYFQNLGSSNISWYTGAFANPSYTTNLFWLTVTYKFDPPPQVYRPAEGRASAGTRPGAAASAAAAGPAPAPAPQVQKITLDSKVLFDFDKAVLKPEGKAAIDSQVVGKLAQVQKLDVVLVTGHTDPLGTDAVQPEAVGASCRCRARLPGQQGRAEGQDRDHRPGREAARRAVRPEEPEGTDRLPAARTAASKSRRRANRPSKACVPGRYDKPRFGGAFSCMFSVAGVRCTAR